MGRQRFTPEQIIAKQRPLVSISRSWLAAMAVGLTWAFIAAPAAAQQHVCPGGAGPGEIFVGMAPGGPGVAPAPLCDWTSQGPAAPAKPPRDPEYWGDPHAKVTLKQGWSASVEGIDKPSVLGMSQGQASRKAAIAAAMDDCRRQGAKECELVTAVEAP